MRKPRKLIRVGDIFNRWTVIARAEPKGSDNRADWVTRCTCGTMGEITGGSLSSGNSKSCGCYNRDVRRERKGKAVSHGMTESPEYRSWAQMKHRCTSKFERYGGRGISVCKRWQDFANFYADMGPRPGPGASVDRIDNDGDYGPDNCRWATWQQQANNRSNNLHLTCTKTERTQTAAQWMRELGISRTTIRRWTDGNVLCVRVKHSR